MTATVDDFEEKYGPLLHGAQATLSEESYLNPGFTRSYESFEKM